MARVLICDKVSDLGIDVLKQAGVEVDVKLKLSEAEIIDIINDYEGVMVRSATKITRPIIEASENLKIIGRAGVGVDNIDLVAATEKGIVVVNSPEGNTVAAAEQTVAMIMASARNIPQAHKALKDGKWDRNKYMGMELRGKVLGVLGLGKIGGEVARKARGLDMEVIGYDPFTSPERAKNLGVELAEFNDIITKADFITCHLPLTPETKYLLGAEQFAMMKPTAKVLNVARGGVINEAELAEALQAGKIGGAALDVFEKEPATEGPLFEMDNVIVTPHLGASTEEAQVNVAIDVAEEMVRMFNEEPVKNAVNIPSIKKEHMEIMSPYIELVEKLGKMLAQMADGNINYVEITYNGPVAEYDVTPLTNTFLKGLLRPIMQEGVNSVNAPHMAKARGIKVYESKSVELEDYANLITVSIATEKGEHSLSGTLFQDGEAKIVRINGYTVDAMPQGHMLIIPHIDKPKVIGHVGSLIGEYDINIAGMIVGRKTLGGKAIMLLQVDGEVPANGLEEIAKLDAVLDVTYVYL